MSHSGRVDVEGALGRACAGLLAFQEADGHFPGDLDQGSDPTAQTIIVEHFLGVLSPADADAATRWLTRHIRRDGSVASYPSSNVDGFAQACTMLGALAAAGVPDTDARRRRVQSWIDMHGGVHTADPLTATFLVMAGVLPATALPEAPIEHALIPGIEAYVGRVLNAYFGLAVSFLLPGLISGLHAMDRSQSPGRITLAARQRIIDHVLKLQNPEGNWVGSQWGTGMALACMFALGVPLSHDAMVRGVESLGRLKRRMGDELHVVPIDGAVWNTAMSVRVLTRARAVGFESASPACSRAIEYLLASQSATPAPDSWTRVAAGAPRTGGWSFERGNPLLSDTDTTAMVLLALADHARDDRVRSAMARGRQWLLALQNDDGGFAAFTRNQRTAPPGPLYGKAPVMPKSLFETIRFFLSPPYEFVDIPTSDLTGRVLSALGRLGLQRSNGSIDRAVRFTYSQRVGDVWWGRWTSNYIAATAFIVPGLVAAGEDARGTDVQRAMTWMVEHQNTDGGFGETNDSYAKPELAGQGPSNAYVTGLALHALCAVGLAGEAPAARAAAYLRDSQRADGLWDEFQAVQLIAAEMFYKNFVNFQTAPIEALAMYREGR